MQTRVDFSRIIADIYLVPVGRLYITWVWGGGVYMREAVGGVMEERWRRDTGGEGV